MPILMLALGVLFWPLLAGASFTWGLPTLQFVPWRELAAVQLADGQFPLWNLLNGGGAPLLANYQSALLYPPNWVTFLLPAAWSMSVLAVLHLLAAGAGMTLLTRALGANVLGASAAGVAFALSGYMVARLGTYPIILAATWIPWMLWAAQRVLSAGRLRDAGWFSLFVAFGLLAGHAQTMWYAGLLVGLFSLWRVVQLRKPLRLLPLALGGLVALAVSAVQLSATAELLSVSQRSDGVDFAFAMNYSLSPLSLLTFLSPNLFGTPADGSFLTGGAYFEVAAYIGLLPISAAVSAAWQGLRHGAAGKRGDVVFWVVLWAIGLLFALGDRTPVFPFLYRNIPTFDLFQAPARWLIWVVIAGCVLAAFGLTWWTGSRKSMRVVRRLQIVSVALALVGGVGWAGAGLSSREPSAVLMRALCLTGTVGIAYTVAIRLQHGRTARSNRWPLAIIGLVALDLAVAHNGLNVMEAVGDSAAREAAVSDGRIYWTAEAVEQTAYGEYFRFEDYPASLGRHAEIVASRLPNVNLITGTRLFNNFDPLLPAHYAAFVRLLEAHPAHDGLHRAAGITERRDLDGVTIFESDARAFFVTEAIFAGDDEEAFALLANPAFDPSRQVILTGAGQAEGTLEGNARVTELANRQGFTVVSDAPGWLVTSDTFYPGWRATIDGETADIIRANLAFRAVPLPAGTHEVVFSYQPVWLTPAVFVSLGGLVLLVTLFMGDRLRSAYNRDSTAA
jgi:hypothetical protein